MEKKKHIVADSLFTAFTLSAIVPAYILIWVLFG